jgi:hypothetical protein
MAGKTHSKWVRVLFGGANLSGDSRSIGSLGLQYDTAEAYGFDATLKERLVGHADAMFGPYQALFNDKAAATGPVQPGAHTTLSAVGQPIASAFIGSGAAPAIGDPAYSMETQQTSYTATVTTSDAVVINADFTTRGNAGTAAKWGKALAIGAAGVTATASLATLDGGVATTAGAVAFLHITTSVGSMAANDWEITIDDSANGTDWTTIDAFLADGSTATAEVLAIPGTFRRYVRATATKTAGTDLVFWINFVRL